ncbi:MAG: LysR family transcriptional regulator [Halioglobus sp.]|nr:LysR family transcriptional regulator [Halioglobus sp.]
MSDFNISNIRKLDGGLLLVFQELVDRRNARDVAEHLSLSQSAISHSLARLRDLFQDPLFVRRPHGLEPTARALELRADTEKLLRLASSLLDDMPQFDPLNSARLFNVAAPEYVTALLAAPLGKSWSKIAPSLWVRYQHLSTEDALEGIKRGEIDIALGRFDETPPPGISQKSLYTDSFCVAARKNHPRISGEISQKQYESESHVLASAQSELTRDERKIQMKMPSAIIVGQWLTALAITSETDSLATCHRRMAEHYRKLLKLQVLNPPFRSYKFTVSALHRESEDSTRNWLVDQIVGCIESGNP